MSPMGGLAMLPEVSLLGGVSLHCGGITRHPFPPSHPCLLGLGAGARGRCYGRDTPLEALCPSP